MSIDAIITLGVLLSAVVLFATEKLPVDVIAILVLGSLLLSGVIDLNDALVGFSSPATIAVAAMFVLSAGLVESGALLRLGAALSKIRSEPRFLLVLMLGIGVLSAVVNNTAAVAVLLPLVLAACAANQRSPSQVLIPMSYAAQMGGVCTLIGTSTNLLVDGLARELGHPGFSLFAFAPLGICMALIGFVYLFSVRRWLLPNHPAEAITDIYTLRKYITELRVMAGSKLIGRAISELHMGSRFGVYVLELLRGEKKRWSPASEILREGDVLLVRGNWSDLTKLKTEVGLDINSTFELGNQFDGKDGEQAPVLLEVVIAPTARFAGSSLAETQFQWRFNTTVLAIQRRGAILREQLKNVPIQVGDILLMLCPQTELPALRANPSFILLSERARAVVPKHHPWVAALTLAVVVGAAATGMVSIVAAAIIGAAMLVAMRIINSEQAYGAIDWRVIILLAGIFPLGIAMQKTGLADLIANRAMMWVGDFGPAAMLSALYLLTALLTELMSNNAAAVLIVPIASATAHALGIEPTPFFVAVLFAASTSFATPVGYQTNTMVMGPGRYRFADYLKIGVPLNLIFWVGASMLIPVFFPFVPSAP